MTLGDSGKLRSPLASEEEKGHVSEGNLDVSMAPGAVCLKSPQSGGTVF